MSKAAGDRRPRRHLQHPESAQQGQSDVHAKMDMARTLRGRTSTSLTLLYTAPLEGFDFKLPVAPFGPAAWFQSRLKAPEIARMPEPPSLGTA